MDRGAAKAYVHMMVNLGLVNVLKADNWRTWGNFFCNNSEIEYYSGMTKACVYVPNSDCVIKFDLHLKSHYCRTEAENYKKALEAGLGDYFAACEFLEEIDGVEFFVQAKVAADEDDVSDNFRDYYDPASSEYYDEEYLDENDRIYALLGCTAESMELVNFCSENEINDLHAGNWGFDWVSNHYGIIDYSGY